MALKGMRVAVLATDGVEQSELTEPVATLRDAGASVELVSIQDGQIQGVNHSEKADKFDVDYHVIDVTPEDYDAVMLPGGPANADQMRQNQHVQAFLRDMDRAGKPMAVICHGPWELASSGLVAGRRLTSYPRIQQDIREAGGIWEDREVVVDDNWVTSRRPSDLPAFNRAMVTLFEDYRDKAGLVNPYDDTEHEGASHPGLETEDEARPRH